MKYRIIQMIDGEMIVVEPTDIFAWCDVNGVEITGTNNNPRQRAELQGQPKLAGFAGPAWDNGAIRYEGVEVYAHMSF